MLGDFNRQVNFQITDNLNGPDDPYFGSTINFISQFFTMSQNIFARHFQLNEICFYNKWQMETLRTQELQFRTKTSRISLYKVM